MIELVWEMGEKTFCVVLEEVIVWIGVPAKGGCLL